MNGSIGRSSLRCTPKDELRPIASETDERDARIRVQLLPSALNTDFGNFCQVGRAAQVRISKHNLQLTQWIKGLWFNLF